MKLNIKFILLYIVNLILMNNLIVSNYIIKLFPNNGYLVHLLIGLVSIVLVLLLPKNFHNLKERLLNNTLFKIIISITLIFIIILISSISIYHISERFFYLTPTFLIIIFIMYFIYLILKTDITNILNITLLSFIIIIIVSSFHFLNRAKFDFNFILPLSLNFNNPIIILLFVSFYLEGLIFIFIINTKESIITKKDIIISIAAASIISSFLLLQNNLYLTPSFFSDLNFPALYRFRLYFGPKYIEHFDNFLLLIISLYLIPKVSLYLETLRITLNIKKNIYFRLSIFIILSLILIFIFYNYGYNINYLYIPCIAFTIFTFIFYLYFLRSNKHG